AARREAVQVLLFRLTLAAWRPARIVQLVAQTDVGPRGAKRSRIESVGEDVGRRPRRAYAIILPAQEIESERARPTTGGSAFPRHDEWGGRLPHRSHRRDARSPFAGDGGEQFHVAPVPPVHTNAVARETVAEVEGAHEERSDANHTHAGRSPHLAERGEPILQGVGGGEDATAGAPL